MRGLLRLHRAIYQNKPRKSILSRQPFVCNLDLHGASSPQTVVPDSGKVGQRVRRENAKAPSDNTVRATPSRLSRSFLSDSVPKTKFRRVRVKPIGPLGRIAAPFPGKRQRASGVVRINPEKSGIANQDVTGFQQAGNFKENVAAFGYRVGGREIVCNANIPSPPPSIHSRRNERVHADQFVVRETTPEPCENRAPSPFRRMTQFREIVLWFHQIHFACNPR